MLPEDPDPRGQRALHGWQPGFRRVRGGPLRDPGKADGGRTDWRELHRYGLSEQANGETPLRLN